LDLGTTSGIESQLKRHFIRNLIELHARAFKV